MSKQVRLVNLQFTNLETLKKSCIDQGLRVTDSMHTWGRVYQKGDSYGRNLEFVMGIDTGGKSNMGIAKNTQDGTYQLVSETYDAYGLEDVSAGICQRYRLNEIADKASTTGWEIVESPNTMLKQTSRDKTRIVLEQKQTVSIGMMA